jgi:hypothetical protein
MNERAVVWLNLIFWHLPEEIEENKAEMNPFHTPVPCLFKINANIILSPKPRSDK